MAATRKVISGGITGLSYREKDDIGGSAITPWYSLEPNSYSDYGGEVVTVTRNPISRSRQRKKGAVTDFNASGGFNSDFTQRAPVHLLQGFFYANAFQKYSTIPLNDVATAVTNVSASTGYAITNADEGFVVGHLVLARNFGVSTNNGLKHVSGVSSTRLATDTTIAAETTPPADASVEVVGFQGASGDLTISNEVAGLVTIGSTLLDFTTLGLNVGEWVFVGGDAAGNQFAGNVPGYGRIHSIGASALVLDKTTFTPSASTGTGKTVRIFFGTYIRNMTETEIESAGDIVRHVYDFERTLGRDADGIQSQVLQDAFANALTYTQPLSNKINFDMTFVGLGEEWRDGADGLTAGTRIDALGEAAFNTSSCLFRARMALVDPTTLNPTAMFAYVQSIELTLVNNVSAVKVQGDIGGIDTNQGDFEIGGSATVFFSTVAAVQAVRNYSDVTFDVILAQRNAGYVFDIPLMSLGNGRLTVNKDDPITVPLDMSAFENDAGYSASYTNFPYLPTVAMPAA